MSEETILSVESARDLCRRAARAAGAHEDAACAIANAAVAAEMDGQPTVGLAHFLNYLAGLRAGRIDGAARPRLTRPAPALIASDAGGGGAHLGFDLAFDDLVATARGLGVAVFSQYNAYTCGSLGYFAGRLAEAGLIALAAANGPPLLAASGTKKPVFCTNPIAFAAPCAGGAPLLIDQSSSQTAFVNISRAAEAAKTIPEGWAIDAEGAPTTDPKAAMRGALLAFGGARGANVALMVEVLAAGMSGANWSLDAPSFIEGEDCPGVGLFVLALAPALLDPNFAERMGAQLDRLGGEYGAHIPGAAKAAARARAEAGGLRVPADLLARIAAAGEVG